MTLFDVVLASIVLLATTAVGRRLYLRHRRRVLKRRLDARHAQAIRQAREEYLRRREEGG